MHYPLPLACSVKVLQTLSHFFPIPQTALSYKCGSPHSEEMGSTVQPGFGKAADFKKGNETSLELDPTIQS